MTSPVEEAHVSQNTVKPFLNHLIELRTTLIRSFLALLAGISASIPLAPFIMNLLKQPLIKAGKDPASFLVGFEVTAGFCVTMRIVFWSGLIIAAPFIVCFVGGFVFPGLTSRERRVVTRSSLFAVILFAGGLCLCYFVILELALHVMFGISEWIGVLPGPVRITSYLSFCLHLLLAFGLTFELPVLLILLGYLGILSSDQLSRKRAHVIVILLVVAMFVTPPDVFTQLLMAVPLIVLYETAIWIIRLKEWREK